MEKVMKHIVWNSLIYLLLLGAVACTNTLADKENNTAYGNNEEVGQYLDILNSQLYFETYGQKENQPIILIHGNGGSIEAMTQQIEFFKNDYFVVVADNRTHGKSGMAENLTYDLMAEDYILIMDKLNLDSAYILGHSDGGIIGILMAITHPNRISKLVAAVPNIVPGESSVESWELEFSKGYRYLIDSMLQVNDQSRNWQIEKIHMNLMRDEPNIAISELSKIECPVLIMTSDDDIVKPRHILQIFENIPQAHLFVMPGATHFMIRDESELYNMMANRFLSNPFNRPRSKEVLMEIIGYDE